MTTAPSKHGKPHFFKHIDGSYHPSGLARSPWDRQSIAGGPVSAILAHAALDAGLDVDFTIARHSIDIFGKVPFAPLDFQIDVLRDGRQTKLHRITMIANDKAVAQAHVLRVRKMETPVFAEPAPYPLPDAVNSSEADGRFGMGGALQLRFVEGAAGIPGRAVAWTVMEADIVLDFPPSDYERAAIFADYGNGFGNATDAMEWSFANLDITMQFLRMPIGRWMLIDAETHMAGEGHGTVRNIFADDHGIFARGFQTIFVAPGHLSAGLPPSLSAKGLVKR